MTRHRLLGVAACVMVAVLCAANPSAAVTYLGSFGSPGTGPGQFGGPNGMCVTPDGYVYVADTYNSRVQKFTLDGTYVSSFGSNGTTNGKFQRPYGIDTDASGNVYVSDLDRNNVQKFASDGSYLATFGTGVFSQPFGLWVGNDGIVYVTDRPANRIRRFTTSGLLLAAFGPTIGSITLTAPQNVEGDDQGTLYISDGGGNYMVREITTAGGYVASFHNNALFGNPTGTALAQGQLFLTEYNLNRVSVFDRQTRTVVATISTPPSNSPLDCATSGDSLFYVLDTGNSRVMRYRVANDVPPQVSVVAPNGGEQYVVGSVAHIQWTASDDVGSPLMDVALSRDGGTTFQPLVNGLANTGSYDWVVTGPPSATVRIRVTGTGPDGLSASDASNGNFRILGTNIPPQATVVAPNGGESHLIGAVVHVQWNASDDTGSPTIGVYVSRDGGANFGLIANGLSNTGSYDWVASGPPSANARIRVIATDEDGLTATDMSDGDFTIAEPLPPPGQGVQYVGSFGYLGSGPGQLAGPDGICVTPDGFVYVADTYNSRVQKFTLDGTYVSGFGSNGTTDGLFLRPYGIDTDTDGNVYVSDLDRKNVQKFASDGAYLATFGDGVFSQPFGLWVGDDGVVYVTDRPSRLIRRFTTSGSSLPAFGPTIGSVTLGEPQNVEGDDLGTLYISDGVGEVREITTSGGYITSFHNPNPGNPTGTALAQGKVFLTEYNLNRVSVFDRLTRTLQSTITAPPSSSPLDCATSGDSLFYVLDTGNSRVMRYRLIGSGLPPQVTVVAPNGGEEYAMGAVAHIEWNASDDAGDPTIGVFVSRDGGTTFELIANGLSNSGSYDWVVSGPPTSTARVRVIVTDESGLTAVDMSDGDFAILGGPPTAQQAVLFLGSFGSLGQGNQQLAGPDGIATDDDGFVYVADTYNGRVQKFTAAGVYVATIGTPGTGPGQFARPYGIDVDAQGNVYVSDLDRANVQKFAADGTYLLTMGAGSIEQPFGLWVSDQGVVYVTDRPARLVRRYNAGTGASLSSFGPTMGPIAQVYPQNIEGDGSGHLYVSHGSTGFSIILLSTNGDYLGSFGAPWIGNPTGAAFGNDAMFLTEYSLDRVSIVDPSSGAQLSSFDQGGGSSLDSPLDAATTGDSLLYVVDTGNSRVMRYRIVPGSAPHVTLLSPNGGETLPLNSSVTITWSASDEGSITGVDLELSRNGGVSYQTLASGLPNTGSYAWTVAAPTSTNCRIRVTVHDDQQLLASDSSNEPWSIVSDVASPSWLTFMNTFGAYGHGDGQLSGPNGLGIADDGSVYVSDTYNFRVVKFTADGQFVSTFGSLGTGPGQFQRPYGIDVDGDGFVYVSDFMGRTVQKFDGDGNYVMTIVDSMGIDFPMGLWVSDQGVVYVTDRSASKIRRYTTAGETLEPWGPVLDGAADAPGATLIGPQNIEGSPNGRRLYVSDGHNAFRLRVLTIDGDHLATYGDGWIGNPTGSCVLGPLLLLSEYNMERVTALRRRTGEPQATIGDDEPYTLSSPLDVASTGDSVLYILDTGHSRVVRLQYTGPRRPATEVLSPNGGEQLSMGSTIPVRWSASGAASIQAVDVWLSRDGGHVYEQLAENLPNTGQFNWQVAGEECAECVVQVVANDSSEFAGLDDSNAFGIGNGPLSVDGAVTALALQSPVPNPSAHGCRISFALPRAAEVKLTILDIQGREVARVVSGERPAGRHEAVWRGDGGAGRVAPGLYFARLQVAGEGVLERRVVVIH